MIPKYSYYSNKLLDGFLYCFKERVINIRKASTGSIYFSIRNSGKRKDHGVKFRIATHLQKQLEHKMFYIIFDKSNQVYNVIVCGRPNQILYQNQININEKLIITKIYEIYKKYRKQIKQSI